MLYCKVVKVFDVEFKMWPFYGFSWGELTMVTASFINTPAIKFKTSKNLVTLHRHQQHIHSIAKMLSPKKHKL